MTEKVKPKCPRCGCAVKKDDCDHLYCTDISCFHSYFCIPEADRETCPECGSDMEYKEWYNRTKNDIRKRKRPIWQCPKCGYEEADE